MNYFDFYKLLNLVLGALSWLSSPPALVVYFTRDNTNIQEEFSAFVVFNVDRMNVQSDNRPTTQTVILSIIFFTNFY